MLNEKQIHELRAKVIGNARSQSSLGGTLNYLESCIKHGNEIGAIASEIYPEFASKIDYSI